MCAAPNQLANSEHYQLFVKTVAIVATAAKATNARHLPAPNGLPNTLFLAAAGLA